MERSYIGPAFEDARVRDAMRVGVITCRPETKLADVARMMVGYDVHSVVVSEVGGEGELWGIVSSLDLARAPDQLESLTAGEVASRELVTVHSNESLERAAEVMAEHGVTHLDRRAAGHQPARRHDLGPRDRRRARLRSLLTGPPAPWTAPSPWGGNPDRIASANVHG